MALRLATKPWMHEVESLLRRIVENGGQRGELIVHDGNDICGPFDIGNDTY